MSHVTPNDDAVEHPPVEVDGRDVIRGDMMRRHPGGIMERRRRDLHALFGWSCWICGDRFPTYYVPQLDHVVPRSRGGRTTLRNLQLAHRSCNMSRGNRLRVGRKPPKVWWDDTQVRYESAGSGPGHSWLIRGAWIEEAGA